ncbi:MAG: hypothetical protein OER95_18160, partial [Acidimicrobiia bacterium]|nr:hypothetical protein [Acidimicrobiia bacterium]
MSSMNRVLGSVTAGLPGGGETREGQLTMAETIYGALMADHGDDHDGSTKESGNEPADAGDRARQTVIVEAGTGTGKSLAYLTPILAADRRVVVATATIALQGQLVDKDIPTVASGLGRPVSASILKGRGNYLCNQQLKELRQADRNEQLELLDGRDPDHGLKNLLAWADQTVTGDREELDEAPPADLWRAVSVGGDECPGASRCPSGQECFSEAARQEALAADVIVTNQHYYGLHIASGGALIGDHEVVVFDEAHQLPDILGATCGTELGGGRLRAVARRVRSVLTDDSLHDGIQRSADEFDRVLEDRVGQALDIDNDMISIIVLARDRVERALAALQKLEPTEGSNVAARIDRVTLATTRLINDIDLIVESDDADVIWVDGSRRGPILRLTPLDL